MNRCMASNTGTALDQGALAESGAVCSDSGGVANPWKHGLDPQPTGAADGLHTATGIKTRYRQG